jgi:hypothetical protein
MKVIYTLIALKCALQRWRQRRRRQKLDQNKFLSFPPSISLNCDEILNFLLYSRHSSTLFARDDKHHNLIAPTSAKLSCSISISQHENTRRDRAEHQVSVVWCLRNLFMKSFAKINQHENVMSVKLRKTCVNMKQVLRVECIEWIYDAHKKQNNRRRRAREQNKV